MVGNTHYTLEQAFARTHSNLTELHLAIPGSMCRPVRPNSHQCTNQRKHILGFHLDETQLSPHSDQGGFCKQILNFFVTLFFLFKKKILFFFFPFFFFFFPSGFFSLRATCFFFFFFFFNEVHLCVFGVWVCQGAIIAPFLPSSAVY